MSYADKQTSEWMTEHYDLLSATEEFMRRGGQGMGEVSEHQMVSFEDVFVNDLRKLRIKLLAEEFKEYLGGEGAVADSDGELYFVGRADPAEILDGLLDIIVIAWGTALAYFGPTIAKQAANEVVWSNLSKVIGEGLPLLREDGKILKPPGWLAPDIKGVLEGTAGYSE